MEITLAPHSDILVSIIIPCYNSGAFLPDALASVLSFPAIDTCEIIVVDDGSTDVLTHQILEKAKSQGCKVFHQPNKGPAAARNTGIAHAAGRYILFLDSDNKIRHSYITKACAILDAYSEVGVVYGKPNFFGDSNTARFSTHAFDPYKILLRNNIDMCAMIRKSMWSSLGGLDEDRLLIGHEDWEFWIRVAGAGWKFFFIDEILFDYRIREDSLIVSAIKPESSRKLLEYIQKKHYKQYAQGYEYMYKEYCAYKYDKDNPFRSFFKFVYLKYFAAK